MQVLNIAGNKISGKLRLHGVPKLRALIANDNAITAVKGADRDGSMTPPQPAMRAWRGFIT